MGWSKLSNHRHFPFPTYTSWSIFPCFSFVLSFICPASVCLFRHLLSFFFWDTTCSVPLARSSSRYFVAFFFRIPHTGWVLGLYLGFAFTSAREDGGGDTGRPISFLYGSTTKRRRSNATPPKFGTDRTLISFSFFITTFGRDSKLAQHNTPFGKRKKSPPPPPSPFGHTTNTRFWFSPASMLGEIPFTLFSVLRMMFTAFNDGYTPSHIRWLRRLFTNRFGASFFPSSA